MIYSPQALAALLVSVSPELESLAFSPVGWEPSKLSMIRSGEDNPPTSYMFKLFMERANAKNRGIPYLQNLRTVRFLPDSGNELYDDRFYEEYDLYGSLNLVRRLPAVEAVHFDAIVESECPSVRLPPRSANYSKVAIRHSILDYTYHVNIIDSAKNLKEFTFSVGGRDSRDGSHRLISPNHIFKSLLIHRKTLEHLDLDMEDHVDKRLLFDNDYHLSWLDDGEEDEQDKEQYEFEWAEELMELESSKEDSVESPPPRCSLRSFDGLKHLSLGINLLYYYARGIGDDTIDAESFSLVNNLPPNLESLCIYGYEKGMKPQWGLPDLQLDSHMSKLMEEKDEKLPFLKFVQGVDELIPNAKSVEHPDDNEELLWAQEEEDEWTEYEY
jgi:hypothetical protein